jgi:hypothetical protein
MSSAARMALFVVLGVIATGAILFAAHLLQEAPG